MDLSIIIVSWNVKDKLRKNLRALYESERDFSFEIFVVDNNSEDETAGMVKKEFSKVRLIENSANLGFAKANNQVLKHVDSRFVLLLNPDMRVKRDTLKNMTNWMKANRRACVASGRLIDEQGETIKLVRRFPCFSDQLAIVLKMPHFFKGVLKRYIREDFDYAREAEVDSIRGGFMFIDWHLFTNLRYFLDSTIPEFDEEYFLWFEEVDLCRQVKKSGGEIWYTPAAECVDYVGQSFKKVPLGQAQRYMRDSMLYYFKKWHKPWEYRALVLAWPVGIFIAKIGNKIGIKRRAKT